MNGKHFSLVLLSTNQCNAACDYCFEDRTSERLSLERLQIIVDKVLDHMDADQIGALTIHWQGGEAMLLPPQWYQLPPQASFHQSQTIQSPPDCPVESHPSSPYQQLPNGPYVTR